MAFRGFGLIARGFDAMNTRPGGAAIHSQATRPPACLPGVQAYGAAVVGATPAVAGAAEVGPSSSAPLVPVPESWVRVDSWPRSESSCVTRTRLPFTCPRKS